MSKLIEVSLRIPSNTKQPLLHEGYPLDMASVRFRKAMTVDTLPKPGDTLQLAAGPATVEAKVVGSTWDDGKGLFAVACQYAKRSISIDEQNALVADPEWRLEPLI